MERKKIQHLMNQILEKQGQPAVDDETQELRGIGFRSLDFSELALRVEMEVGAELNFDAAALRGIATVQDVLDFFEKASCAA